MQLTHAYPESGPLIKRIAPLDWGFALLLVLGAGYAFARYGAYMDIYERAILAAFVPAAAWFGWFFKPVRLLLVLVAAFALLGVGMYHGDLATAEKSFMLKYFLSSQSAIMWMSALFFFATTSYWVGIFAQSPFSAKVGSRLTWFAIGLGLIGLLTRWYESYLLSPDIGHIPVSNLYEVFILFCLLTSLMYLYYEGRYQTRAMGAFVMLVVSAAVGFLLWYTFERGAQEIQPLVPALQSWWMKIHVPANFIGYGAFSLSAMLGFAYLLKSEHVNPSQRARVALWGAAVAIAVALGLEGIAFRTTGISPYWASYFAITLLIFGLIVAFRDRVAPQLPAPQVLEEVMYRAISVGFAFFTVATILGALWAAEAWGSYWSWDPKETWALIVWLNYAAWLHLRLIGGMRGPMLAWWALVGLLVTTFAFLGVNIFLSGLHSYGTL
jgi:cytochrome c-type biogenesis protein CcsB